MKRVSDHTLIDEITESDDQDSDLAESAGHYYSSSTFRNKRASGRGSRASAGYRRASSWEDDSFVSGQGINPEYNYRAAYGRNRENRRRNAQSSEPGTMREKYDSDKDTVPSEAKMFRLYKNHPTYSNSPDEVNARPLQNTDLGYFPASRIEGYAEGGCSNGNGPHSYVCSRCHRSLTLWSLVSPELPKILCVTLIVLLLFRLHRDAPITGGR